MLTIYTFDGKFLENFLSIITAEYTVLYLENYYGGGNWGSLLSEIIGVREQSPLSDAKALICL